MPTVYEAIEAFLGEHRRCGELEGGVSDATVWMACTCGGAVARLIPTRDAAVEDAWREFRGWTRRCD